MFKFKLIKHLDNYLSLLFVSNLNENSDLNLITVYDLLMPQSRLD